MTLLSAHHSSDFTKIVAMGNSKSGKTGSLVSLVKAGYKLRILDMDNLLDILKTVVVRECPKLIDNVEYRTLRDVQAATPEGPKVVSPKAYMQAVKMMDRWKYDDVDLGVPGEWGPDCILVVDSLSRLCDAAFDFREPLTPRGRGGTYDQRATYGDAQRAIEDNLFNLSSANFRTNVIIFTHIIYQDMPDGMVKGFPQGIGQKLSPKIPQFFPTIILYTNQGGKRFIQTNSSPLVDLANPKPFEMQPKYPIETGLADIFEVLRGKKQSLKLVGGDDVA